MNPLHPLTLVVTGMTILLTVWKKFDYPSWNVKMALVIIRYLIVYSDMAWQIYIHRHHLDQERCPALQDVPSHLNVESFKELVTLLDNLHVCPGNPDIRNVWRGVRARRESSYQSREKQLLILTPSVGLLTWIL